MEEDKAWGEKFRQFYARRFKTLGELGLALADYGLTMDTSVFSNWQKGQRVPQKKEMHLLLIKAFAKLNLIYTPAEANEWLGLAGVRSLNQEELKELFPAFQNRPAASSGDDGPSPSETGQAQSADESPFYVERREDHLLRELIKRQGVTITIKGPRYVGKSSMLMRLAAEASRLKRVVILDFRQFGLGRSELANAADFFYQFCQALTDELQLEDQIEKYWDPAYSNPRRCTRYMELHLLKQLGGPLLLAMDEADRLFNTDFCDDFFGMLRGWHDYRALTSPAIWRQLDLILTTSTEPYRFIKDPNQSLFNVSISIDVPDFTADQIAQLNGYYGSPLNTDEVRRLMELAAGHPDLARRALEWVAGGRGQATDLFNQATDDYGPFGPHLRRHLDWLLKHPQEKAAMIQVIEHHTLSKASLPVLFRLEGAGLVRRDKQQIVPRCQLYADYFREQLHE
ncbi:MAG: hypothetical protein DPW09_22620 [Anaerolineae bacterium]|nr:AAA-like domain-containing protein [Anaerolineales bacterium]MCQ3976232.1 hypothetical protein [Anaerolineae bacterium]